MCLFKDKQFLCVEGLSKCCLNLSIAASCQVQEVKNLIDVINEAHLFLSNSPKRQSMFELTIAQFLPATKHSKLSGLCKTSLGGTSHLL